MCVNNKWIYNRFLGQSVLVPCGKCPSCQMSKANKRSARINHAISDYTLHSFFLTLTYDNRFIPYIRLSDLDRILSDNNRLAIDEGSAKIPVYRDYDMRRVRLSDDFTSLSSEKYKMGYRQFKVCSPIDYIDVDWNMVHLFSESRSFLHPLEGDSEKDKISIAYYRDFQLFKKRLQTNLKRRFNYDGRLYSFQCTEYGPSTSRGHFHASLLCEKDEYPKVRAAVLASWPYARGLSNTRIIEDATKPSSYLATYVNKPANLSRLFEHRKFRAKHVFSKDFGIKVPYFELSKILEKIRERDISYTSLSFKNGAPEVIKLPVPQYVINRFFPRFKGDCRLTDDEVRGILVDPERIFYYKYKNDLTLDECRGIAVRLRNAYRNYYKDTGKGKYDFAFDYVSCYVAKRCTSMRAFYGNIDCLPYHELYDNIVELSNNRSLSPVLYDLLSKNNLSFDDLNPNNFKFRQKTTSHLESLYRHKMKTRHVTNLCMQSQGCNV